MKIKNELLRDFDEVLQYFINHDANKNIEFSNQISKLINIKAELNEFSESEQNKIEILIFKNSNWNVDPSIYNNIKPISKPKNNWSIKNIKNNIKNL